MTWKGDLAISSLKLLSTALLFAISGLSVSVVLSLFACEYFDM